MPLSISQSLIMFGVMALVTAILRVTPFLMFPDNKETPKYILYLGKVLPNTIIAMLVVYCLKDINLFLYPNALPEIIAIIVIIILHIWKRNTLLSIASGTFIYILLVQNIF
ncbi:MAG TPA: branched-chain amino acid transporter AzlD [Clostridiales bacterium]|nr:branched-chain amino acid transporter AzlD [Clostridiales bacterium]